MSARGNASRTALTAGRVLTTSPSALRRTRRTRRISREGSIGTRILESIPRIFKTKALSWGPDGRIFGDPAAQEAGHQGRPPPRDLGPAAGVRADARKAASSRDDRERPRGRPVRRHPPVRRREGARGPGLLRDRAPPEAGRRTLGGVAQESLGGPHRPHRGSRSGGGARGGPRGRQGVRDRQDLVGPEVRLSSQGPAKRLIHIPPKPRQKLSNRNPGRRRI